MDKHSIQTLIDENLDRFGAFSKIEDLKKLSLIDGLIELSAPVIIFDAELRIVFANPAYAETTGKTLEEMLGNYIFDVFPESEERMEFVRDKILTAASGTPTTLDAIPFDLTDEFGNAKTHYWKAVQEPLRGPDGDILWVAQRVEDVSEIVSSRQERDMIAEELNHRTKNILAVVESMTRMSARTDQTKDEFTADLIGRFNAMTRNHTRFYDGNFQDIPVRTLLLEELETVSNDSVISLRGPDVLLSANTAKDLSMVIHELSTNAAKYGCFRHDAGYLTLNWTLIGESVSLDWQESGCGAVGAFKHRGFGSKLMQMMKGIDVKRTPTDDGLHVEILVHHPMANA